MAEYIDKEAAMRAVLGESTDAHYPEWYAAILMELPTADVAPVRHGRWNIMEGEKMRRVCSKCGWDVPEYGKFYSYCPDCGAKMDGWKENAAD